MIFFLKVLIFGIAWVEKKIILPLLKWFKIMIPHRIKMMMYYIEWLFSTLKVNSLVLVIFSKVYTLIVYVEFLKLW
jgi:hypothetical protein